MLTSNDEKLTFTDAISHRNYTKDELPVYSKKISLPLFSPQRSELKKAHAMMIEKYFCPPACMGISHSELLAQVAQLTNNQNSLIAFQRKQTNPFVNFQIPDRVKIITQCNGNRASVGSRHGKGSRGIWRFWAWVRLKTNYEICEIENCGTSQRGFDSSGKSNWMNGNQGSPDQHFWGQTRHYVSHTIHTVY